MAEEKAAQVQDGEPPRKVAKTLLSSDTSERRVRSEVQALLVGTDLSAVTLGQLRVDLEARLGLDRGFFMSRSSLQRWICGVIQHETVKRGQRSSLCERVAKALVEFRGYPSEARQMLIESLPHAIPEGSGPLHAHQARLLSIAQDALSDARRAAQTAQEEFLERTQPEAAALSALLGERDAAAGRGAAAALSRQESALSLGDAEQEVSRTKSNLQSAEGAVQSARDERKRIEKARQDALALRDGAFQQLLGGELPKDERAVAIEKVTDFVRQESAPASLSAATPIALRRDPGARSSFERTIVEALRTLFAEHDCKAQEQLASEPELTLGPAVAEARALAEAAEARVAERTAARDGTQAAWETAAGEQRVAARAVEERQEAEKPRLAEQDRHAKKVQELDGILEAVDGLLAAGSESSEAPPGSGDAEQVASKGRDIPNGTDDAGLANSKNHVIHPGNDDAGFVSPRKVATPMSERRPHEAFDTA
uniref:Uncharacterized protein n=1 Tax=Alexandrium catenella TaxID=2925 RepID=A0A7S1RG78_ALECA|mmetsp:Transcript_56207/g.150436  ORF Transcript_56207/g.150436 Transcript_56207/m.150436 type:complete len:484 (+) Transcript_56207:53-1504(+)